MSLTGIKANHWKAPPLAEFITQPVRHPARLEDNTDDMLHFCSQSACGDIWVGGFFERRHDVAAIIPLANCRCILRYINAKNNIAIRLPFF